MEEIGKLKGEKKKQQLSFLAEKQTFTAHSSYLLQLQQHRHNDHHQNIHFQTMQMSGNTTKYQGFKESQKQQYEQNIQIDDWKKVEFTATGGKRDITERMATKQLLEIDMREIYGNKNVNSNSVSRSKSRKKKSQGNRRSHTSIGRKTVYKEVQEGEKTKVNIIHGVYNRNQHNQSYPTVRDPSAQKQNKPQQPTTRHLSNFELLKLEAQQLQKSNIVLGTKQPLHPQKSSTKELSLKQHLPQPNIPTNPTTRTQRYRYKHSMSNRNQLKNKGKSSNIKNKNMESTLSDMKSYYQHIQNQIHNRSKHKLSAEDGQMERTDQLVEKFVQDRSFHQRKSSVKEHHKSASQWNIGKKNSKQVQTQNSSSYLKTQTQLSHLSHPLKPAIQTNPFNTCSQPEYLIRNQFIPLANRSILDKNRHNIKKIGKNMNRLLTSNGTRNTNVSTNTNRRCNTMTDQIDCLDKAANDNIQEFVKNKMSILDLCAKAEGRKNVIAMQSFYNKSLVDYSEYQQNCQSSHIPQTGLNPKQKNSKTTSEASLQIQKNGQKISNAAKFYRPQIQKSKQKAGVMVIDPHLKAKAIQISGKDNKTNNNIVIICL